MTETTSAPASPRRERFHERGMRILAALVPSRRWLKGIIAGGMMWSVVMTLLIVALPWIRPMFGDGATIWLASRASGWIIFFYFAWQMAVIAARQPTDLWEAFGDVFISLLPAIVGTFIWILPWFAAGGFFMQAEEWAILNNWLAWLWLEAVMGFILTIRLAYRTFEGGHIPVGH